MNVLRILVCILLAFQLQAQDQQELIQKHLLAIGGETNWEKIKTVKVEGIVYMSGVQIKTTKHVIRDKAWRNDMVFEGKTESLSNNKYYVTIFGDAGWKYLPDSKDNKPEPLVKSEIAVYKEDMDFEDPFVRYKEKGTKISFLSLENILEENYYKFAFTFSSGKQEYIYVREKDMMIAKRVLYNSDSEDAKEFDYYQKQSNGILYPMIIKTTVGEIRVQRVQINPEIQDKIFQPGTEKQ